MTRRDLRNRRPTFTYPRDGERREPTHYDGAIIVAAILLITINLCSFARLITL